MVQHPCYTCPEIREGEACVLLRPSTRRRRLKPQSSCIRTEIRLMMVREFEKQAESKGYQSMTKEAGKYAEEYGLQLQLKHPDPVGVTEEGEVVPGDKLKTPLRKLRESRMEGVVEEQKWQGKLITARKEDGDLNTEQCFWWLNDWRMCPTNTIAGIFEIYEQLLPTRLYAIHKTQVLIVILPAGCAVQHQRAWLIYSLLVLHWPKQSTWQGMTQF